MTHLFRNKLMPAVVVACASVGDGRANDIDEDGLDDDLEQSLIDLYRPHLFYDDQEDNWPARVDWVVQHSQLVFTFVPVGPPWPIVYTEAELAANPLLILNATDEGYSQPSTTTWHPEQSAYRVDINNAYHHGPFPYRMYAHVVPLAGPVQYTNSPLLPVGSDDVLVQFWQFHTYNDSQSNTGFGNHEGDWIYLDVYCRREPPHELRFIVYHHHGDSNCAPTVLPWDYPFALPSDGVPKCYLEEGSHEWWPAADSPCPCFFLGFTICDPHDGALDHGRPDDILNLGERYAPMAGIEPQLVLFFNGQWGSEPGGDPANAPMHQSPPGYPLPPALYVAYVDHSAPPWSQEGLGSQYHPFQVLSAGVDAVGTGGRVRIAPAEYGGAYTIDRAMTLEAWGDGTVTIGQ